MFKIFSTGRRNLMLLMIALVTCLTVQAISAQEVEIFNPSQAIDLGGQPFQDPDEDEPDPDPWSFQDPDEDEPDPDPFQDPDEDEPDPDPFQDPDEDEPDPDPFVETFPLALHTPMMVRFQMNGAALVTLHDALGQRLFAMAEGGEVVVTLGAGQYELRVEEWPDTRGAVELLIEQVLNP